MFEIPECLLSRNKEFFSVQNESEGFSSYIKEYSNNEINLTELDNIITIFSNNSISDQYSLLESYIKNTRRLYNTRYRSGYCSDWLESIRTIQKFYNEMVDSISIYDDVKLKTNTIKEEINKIKIDINNYGSTTNIVDYINKITELIEKISTIISNITTTVSNLDNLNIKIAKFEDFMNDKYSKLSDKCKTKNENKLILIKDANIQYMADFNHAINVLNNLKDKFPDFLHMLSSEKDSSSYISRVNELVDDVTVLVNATIESELAIETALNRAETSLSRIESSSELGNEDKTIAYNQVKIIRDLIQGAKKSVTSTRIVSEDAKNITIDVATEVLNLAVIMVTQENFGNEKDQAQKDAEAQIELAFTAIEYASTKAAEAAEAVVAAAAAATAAKTTVDTAESTALAEELAKAAELATEAAEAAETAATEAAAAEAATAAEKAIAKNEENKKKKIKTFIIIGVSAVVLSVIFYLIYRYYKNLSTPIKPISTPISTPIKPISKLIMSIPVKPN